MTDISPTLLQQENESYDEWRYRIVTAKVNKEIDLDWIEIRDLLKVDCSPDHLRKMGQGIADVYTYFKNKGKESFGLDDFTKEIDLKQRELDKMKVQFRDQRREYNKLIMFDGRFDNLKQEIIESVKELSTYKPLTWKQPLPYPSSEREGVLLLSDWHYGIESNNYWNKFNPKIFIERIKTLTKKAIEYGKEAKLKKLHVFSLGDQISGLIHVSVRVQQAEDTIRQVMVVSETISEMLTELSSHFEEVLFYNVRGNHDRITPSKHEQIAKESFADLIPWYVKPRTQHIKNLRVMENTYDDEMIVADVCGHKVIGVHGHKDRVSEVAANLTTMLRIIPTTICMGHYHHNWEKEFNNIDVVVNSTLSGIDEYARDIRRISKPMQKMLVFDTSGQINTYKILL